MIGSEVPRISKLLPGETKDQSIANRVVKFFDPEMVRVLNLSNQVASISETILDLTTWLEADGDDAFLYMEVLYQTGVVSIMAEMYSTDDPNLRHHKCLASNQFIFNSLAGIIKTDTSGQIHYTATLVGLGSYTLTIYLMGVATPIPDHKHDI